MQTKTGNLKLPVVFFYLPAHHRQEEMLRPCLFLLFPRIALGGDLNTGIVGGGQVADDDILEVSLRFYDVGYAEQWGVAVAEADPDRLTGGDVDGVSGLAVGWVDRVGRDVEPV